MNATTTDFGAELPAVAKAVPELRREVREWFGEDVYGCVGEGTPVSVRVGCGRGARGWATGQARKVAVW